MKKQVLERAIKTFVEAFIPAIVTALAAADYTDIDTLPRVLIAVLLSAAATGISAVWNGILEPMLKKVDSPFEETDQGVDWEKYEAEVAEEMQKREQEK